MNETHVVENGEGKAGQVTSKTSLYDVVLAAQQMTTSEREALARMMSVFGKRKYAIHVRRVIKDTAKFEVMATDERDARLRYYNGEAQEVRSEVWHTDSDVFETEQIEDGSGK